MMIFTRRLGAFDLDRGDAPAEAANADAAPVGGAPAGPARAGSAPVVAGTLRLTYDWRQKSRCRVRISEIVPAASGPSHPMQADMEVGLDLPRGAVLRDGDLVATEDGLALRVHAAIEQLLQVRAPDARSLTRIAYHLGNRHVPVQVGTDAQAGWLRLQLDHVLENMVVGLGGTVQVLSAPFDPEAGAYGASGAHAHPGHGQAHADAPEAAPDGSQSLPDRRHAPRIHDFTERAP